MHAFWKVYYVFIFFNALVIYFICCYFPFFLTPAKLSRDPVAAVAAQTPQENEFAAVAVRPAQREASLADPLGFAPTLA